MKEIVLIVHDIRSCHNVGSLLRTAEGLGVSNVYLSGYSPYPATIDDERLPHISQKLTAQIRKTALGAEQSQAWEHYEDIEGLLTQLAEQGYKLVALEQSQDAMKLSSYKSPNKIALLLGSEVSGVDPKLLARMSEAVAIPMLGSKESFNVVQAAAMALYQLRFH